MLSKIEIIKQLAICVFFLVFSMSCHQETFNQIDSLDFQKFIDDIPGHTKPSELPFLYYYAFQQLTPPAMIKVSTTKWKEDEVTFVSSTFNEADDSVREMKISIGYKGSKQGLLVAEIRESWSCIKGRGYSTFGNKKCI